LPACMGSRPRNDHRLSMLRSVLDGLKAVYDEPSIGLSNGDGFLDHAATTQGQNASCMCDLQTSSAVHLKHHRSAFTSRQWFTQIAKPAVVFESLRQPVSTPRCFRPTCAPSGTGGSCRASSGPLSAQMIPGDAAARDKSMAFIRAWASGLLTNAACSICGS
jgi:hypothetical protein